MAGLSGSRLSAYSNASLRAASGASPGSNQVSTQTLLTSLHTAYSSGTPYALDANTSLVVNTWITAAVGAADGSIGGTVDADLARRAWEHARRRAEDGCIILGSLHESTPSVLASFVTSLPLSIPSSFYTALAAIQPFLNCATPRDASTSRASALATTFSLTTAGEITGLTLRLSSTGIDTEQGLTNLSSERGFRAFDAFYYLLSSASTPNEREALGLKRPSAYALLRKSQTYNPPAYMPTADDTASAENFRSALKAIGVTGSSRRELLSTLAAFLKLGETLGILEDQELDSACDDVASLLGVDTDLLKHGCSAAERENLIGGIYEALVDWLLLKANEAITAEVTRGRHDAADGFMSPSSSEVGDVVSLTVLELPSEQLGKAVSLKTIFDDTEGINAEMKLDDISVAAAGYSVVHEMKTAVAARAMEMGVEGGQAVREKRAKRDRMQAVVRKVSHHADEDSVLRSLLHPSRVQQGMGGPSGRFDLMTVIGSSRVWFHLSLHPTDSDPSELAPNAPAWSAGSISRQLRAWRLPEWANRRNKQLDFTADFDFDEFCTRYSRLGCKEGQDGIEIFALERGWSNGEVVIGKERVWIREGAWWEAETMLEMLPPGFSRSSDIPETAPGLAYSGDDFYRSPFGDDGSMLESRHSLLQRYRSTNTIGTRSLAPTATMTMHSASGVDKEADMFVHESDPELGDQNHVESAPITVSRRVWVTIVWALTFWIPSHLLRDVGHMKRPDVRMAWREKLVLVAGIFLLNVSIVFYIIVFGRLLCPNYDKAWNPKEVSYHQGNDDFYISIRGSVYDISKFWRLDHSSIPGRPVTSGDMQIFAGLDVTPMFGIPLATACPGLVTDDTLTLIYNQTDENAAAIQSFSHLGGSRGLFPATKPLNNPNFYNATFLPRMKDYYKGELVRTASSIRSAGQISQVMWFTLGSDVYDLSNYFYTLAQNDNYEPYQFFDADFVNQVQEYSGQDLSDYMNSWNERDSSSVAATMRCLRNEFYIGKTDFRTTARCQVNNFLLLTFTIILCVVILTKFLAALQLGSKKRPTAQDKFVICQVPAYTEGEEHLRKGLDSLTALAYDNKRKLICVICDGMIVGSGNDRPTPNIVLDILGVDPKIDPPALPFRSVGQSSEQLNYGKVYSGLYEYEGNVVPYIVVVKVGKESEQTKSKPGNRGKRDSQTLLMSFLNRVHHRSPMSPLELEMFHQINNIIGVDPELYEYLFMVDADTMVKEDSLNRLVAACANDAKIAGICGETSLENEERSWWTMIQVYEYFISHHLAKSFESLFGSVTCLPGCFCMYRLRTADKGKPLIISDQVIAEYADCDVDTLHKKNLLSLGEDRYLTTLMTKHFPHMSYKFVPGAMALTAAPETWSILLSQRRRWINSTIHNLVELMCLKDLCGFCCFSMRFVVFIDLSGTLILPATCVYLVYLIFRVASHSGQFPLFSLIMIAAVYGLQAVIFIIKRQWQHIGWMIIYILAYPVYSLILPIYAFWKQDDFSWGNTRIVIGEKGDKKVLAVEDEGFDPRSIPLQSWDDYAAQNNLPGRRGLPVDNMNEKGYSIHQSGVPKMDEMRSLYSSARPASTILTDYRSHILGGPYMPSQSPVPFTLPGIQHRQSTYADSTRYTDYPSRPNTGQTHLMSLGNMSDATFRQQQMMQQRMSPYGGYFPNPFQSSESLMGTAPLNRAGTMNPGSFLDPSRPSSTLPDFETSLMDQGQPSDDVIVGTVQAVLSQVDLDTVTKKQVRALVEQRLQRQLNPAKHEFLDHMIDVELANM